MIDIDRTLVREDYRNGMTVRQIAEKYNIPKSTIGLWVKKYGWTKEVKIKKICELHSIPEKKLEAPSSSKMDNKVDAEESGQKEKKPTGPEISLEDYEILRKYVMKILAKADQLLDLDDALAPRDLKSLTSMLMDARVLMGALSPAEAEEQRLRIAGLRKQSEDTGNKEEIAVSIMGMSVDEIGEVIG